MASVPDYHLGKEVAFLGRLKIFGLQEVGWNRGCGRGLDCFCKTLEGGGNLPLEVIHLPKRLTQCGPIPPPLPADVASVAALSEEVV